MPRPRTSPIWNSSDKEFHDLCKKSKTMAEALRSFGLENKGNNYKTFKKRVNELEIDTSHFLNRTQSSAYGRKKTLSEILIKDSSYNRCHLKNRLIKESILKYECHMIDCNIVSEWKGQPVSLHLDHINGMPNDNRLTNLRLLCPNCHSQTDTYSKHNKHVDS